MRPVCFCLSAVVALLFVVCSVGADDIPPLNLDGDVEPFVPRVKRDEAAEDKITAASLYAHGRILLQREEYDQALRRFQRAYRYDPGAKAAMADAIDLAFQLKRSGEAARYALLGDADTPIDPVLLRRLAIYLTEQGEWEDALPLYERSLKEGKFAKDDVSYVLTMLEVGRLYTLSQQYEKGAEAFEIVVDSLENPDKYGLKGPLKKLVSDNADRTYALIAECYLELKKLPLAEAMFIRANDAKKEPALLSFNLARVEAARNNPDKAIEKLNKYFAAKATDVGIDAYELLQKIHTQKFKEEAEAKTLERLKALHANDPENASLSFFYAQSLKEAGELESAAKVYEQLISATPTLDAYQNLIEIYHSQQNTTKLVTTFAHAVNRVGDLDPFEEQLEGYEKADLLKLLKKADELLRQKEPPAGLAAAAGLLAIQAEKFDMVNRYFRQAIENEENKAPLYLTFGLELLIAEQNEASAKLLQEAIDKKVLAENSSAFSYYLAASLAYAEKYEPALQAAQAAVKGDPDSVHFQSRVGWVHYQAEAYTQATAAYEKLLKKFDSNHESEENRNVMRSTRLVLSNIALAEKEIPAAVEWLEQVLDEYPGDIGAMNDLGYLWADENMHLNRAYDMIQQAVKAEPENAAYRDSLGWVLYRLGRVEEAIPHLESAAEDIPDGEIVAHLAEVLQAAGKTNRANEEWSRAIGAYKEAGDEDMAKQVEARMREMRNESK